MAEMRPETPQEIRDMVYEFFAQECDVDPAKISDSTNIIEELEGDSLMFLMLLEKVRKRYGIGVQLETLAKQLMKRPASTVGQVIQLSVAVVEHGGDLANVEL